MFTAPRHGQSSACALRRHVAAAIAALLILQSIVFTPRPAQAAQPLAVSNDVVISQVYGGGGNSGATLKNDFIELFNRGTTAVELTGYSLQYSGATSTFGGAATNAAVYFKIPSGTIQPGGYFLVQGAQGAGGSQNLSEPDAISGLSLGGTSGKIALVSNGDVLASTACPTPATGSSAVVVDFVAYGSTANCSETSPAGGTSNTTAAVRKSDGCADTDNNSADFNIAAPTPRNSKSPINSCGGDATPTPSPSATPTATPTPTPTPPVVAINAIQGSGAASPLVGQVVTTTSNVVTARKTNGFFMQTPDANVDADATTSEGIFVFTTSAPTVAVGDAVTVSGTVIEFNNLTELGGTVTVTVNSSGNPLPTPVALTTAILNPAGTRDQLERFEGMLLRADALTTVAPSNQFSEVYTVLSGVGRPFREPGIGVSEPLPPNSPCCVPRFDENPERIMVDLDGQAGASPRAVTSGVTLSNVVGPLDFSFGNYKILPDASLTVSANIGATPVPAPAANEFTVASFNLENFYSTTSNFNTRVGKASLAIRNVMRSPDVIGVEEVGDIRTLNALADRINSDAVAAGAANPNYRAYLLEGDDDTEQDIDVGFLVKTSRVAVTGAPVQEYKGKTFTFNGETNLLHDRPPLILRVETLPTETAGRLPVTIIVNHLRSLIDVEQGARVREKRRLQAEDLANLAQRLQNENLVLVGDFNAFQFNDGYVDVIGTIRGAPAPADQVVAASPDLVNPDLTDLVDTDLIAPDQKYSFVFDSDGNAQVLDHILVNAQMLRRASRFAYARNNADFPDAFGSDAARSERVSDHDMPVAYFTLPAAVPPSADLSVAVAASPDPVQVNSPLTYTITVRNAGPDAAEETVVANRFAANAVSASSSQGSCGAVNGTAPVTCNLGTLAAGASATVTVVVMPTQPYTLIVHRAEARSRTSDPNPSNNVAETPTRVVGPTPTALQFSAPDYSVNEGAASVTVTVARVGDLSGTITVDYATADGTASQRSDYIYAAGTLRFAPGETFKTFMVLIVDDGFAEGSETINIVLSNPSSGASLTAPSAATLVINDNDTTPPTVNPIDAVEFFVRQQYLDFLSREPDAAGFEFWTDTLRRYLAECGTGDSPAANTCRARAKAAVSEAFFVSVEFQQTGYLVYRFYLVGFNPNARPKGGLPRYAEFMRDAQEVGRGVVVNEAGWEQKLEANTQQFAREFVQRAEFLQRYPASMTKEDYVNALIDNAGLPQNGAEEQAALAAYGAGDAESRARALRAVAESKRLFLKEFNRAFVLMEYFGYLRRNPNDPQDTDYSGYDFWLKKLNDESGDTTRFNSIDELLAPTKRARMVEAFVVTGEYRRRFGPE